MAGESDGGEESASLETTPTWAVATVCFVLISISLLLEHGLHLLAKYLGRKRRKSLLGALNKIKSDLLLLGFISFSLVMLEKPIATICIPRSAAETFLPCKSLTTDEDEEPKCEENGKMSLMSRGGVQELQVLIFFLAFFHVLSTLLTFTLGAAKMKRWEHWEAETRTLEYQFSNDPRRFQFIHQTSFGRRHLRYWSQYRLLRLPVNFLRQFFRSVYQVDYLTLRHGFITAHFAEGNSFDFQKYIKRALEKDFEVAVGMRLWIWVFSVLFIFFNAYVFNNYVWLPFIPLVMLLIAGTKLQGIITKMCLDTSDKSHVIQGTLLVRPSDHFFWFDQPRFLLHLMHLLLFQNSFELAFFAWSWYKFGLRSCFHRKNEDIVIKIAMGVLIPILCGYVTLPLYALVTQMGTSMGNSVFPENVVGGLKRWRAKARRNLAARRGDLTTRSLDASVESSPSFANLDASLPLDLDYTSDDDGIERSDHNQQQQQQLGSFHGIEPSRV
ncbi:MLO-like protein 12 [Salvia splendens]|uniref:MLO-like protein 12 n=1 Tax=Salvia splendens TaxID=180675 RepID=UPI001C266E02|nr:MLO-like protein 12 [Salvia splendens]